MGWGTWPGKSYFLFGKWGNAITQCKMSVKWNLNQNERDRRHIENKQKKEEPWWFPFIGNRLAWSQKSYRKSRQFLNESTYSVTASSFEATQPWTQLSQVERKDCIFCGYRCLSQLLLETSRRFESTYLSAGSSSEASIYPVDCPTQLLFYS